MKKRLIVYTVVLILVVGLLFTTIWYNPVIISQESYAISASPMVCATNVLQSNASVIMTTYNGSLYVLPWNYNTVLAQTKYHEYICLLQNGSIERMHKIQDAHGVMVAGNYFYYTRQNRLYCYDIAERAEVLLMDNIVDSVNFHCSSEGILYMHNRLDNHSVAFHGGCEAENAPAFWDSYILNGCRYLLSEDGSDVLRLNEYGVSEIIDIPYGSRKTLVMTDFGLLIHNEGQGDLLYLISKDSNDIVELFTIECMVSVSTIALQGNNVYLSVKRYEEHGDFGMLRYENDTLEGTYRISLIDYSVEKLSDEIYNGLYIFDDTGIYACDENCNIYKLDFDGQRILTILEHK